MGIPIGWNVKRNEPKEKDVLRADVTGQRSPIRRRIRPGRSPTAQSAFDPDFLVSASRFAPPHEPVSRPSHARTRLAPPPVPEVSRTDYRSNEASRDPPTLQRDESSLRRSRDRLEGYMRAYEARAPLDNERSLPALTPGFAPAAASRNAEAGTQSSRVRERSPARRRPLGPNMARVPPWGRVPVNRQSSDNVDVAGDGHESSDNSGDIRERSPDRRRPLGPNMARVPPWGRVPVNRRSNDNIETVEEGHESRDNNAVGFPPLRRMGRRTIADGPLPSSSLRESWSPVSTLDGLGDRERSVSPMDEQLPWDTFLSTVVPDPVAPTAESSFASAAAAASFSNSHPSSRAGSSNSATSSRTHLTVPSRRHSPQNEQFMRACDTSDDTASDTEEEEEWIEVPESTRPLVGGLAPPRPRVPTVFDPVSSRRRMRPSYFSNEPPLRDTERYSRRVLERSRDASAYVRSFYNSSTSHDSDSQTGRRQIDQLDGPADERSSATGDEEMAPLMPLGSPPLDQELRDARSLLERLSRREDISDDFWASVGLTRSFADPVERFQERERH